MRATRARRRGQQLGGAAATAALVATVAVISTLGGGDRSPTAGHNTTLPPTNGPTTAKVSTATATATVHLSTTAFQLAPGQTFDKFTDQIRLRVFSPMCSPVTRGLIQPRLTYSPGRLEIALYGVVTTAVEPPGCLGGLATTSYTVDLPSTRPLGSRTVVLDHSRPDNPAGARPIPADAEVSDYLDSIHPDRVAWTSDHPVYDLWLSGTSSACGDQIGYLSLLFPTDGYAVFEPDPTAPADVTLPLQAEDTRYRAGPVQLWVDRDMSAAYLVVGDDVRRWVPARGCLVRALDLPRS